MASASLERLVAAAFRVINRRRVWYRLPVPLAVANLVALRIDLRLKNVFDTETAVKSPSPPAGVDVRSCRTADGSFNDLAKPWMGMVDTRFARNAPLAQTFGENPPDLYDPNPRAISRDLLARRDFIPATSVNLLLPAWLQFMVHDWLSHGVNDPKDPHLLPLPPGDDWPQTSVSILRTCSDKQRTAADEGRPATVRNMVTHWWDGSQMYGSDAAMQERTRSRSPARSPVGMLANGKLHLDETGHLPLDPEAADKDQEFAAVNGNWWIGLSAMHTLFTREHNAIVDRLAIEYPAKDGEWLFQKARLINAALIIKIHATEWTPALLHDRGTLIVSTRSRIPNENRVYEARGRAIVARDKPIVVLIDRYSASAAEILTGALKDYGRATIMGEKSYGKGSVQEVVPIETGGFRLTTARYYTPSGTSIDQVGIQPDRAIEQPEYTDEEIASARKLVETNAVQDFVKGNPKPTEPGIAAFIAKLKGDGIVLREDRIRKSIRDEVNRVAGASPVYDLEFDKVLQEAVGFLRGGGAAAAKASVSAAPAAAPAAPAAPPAVPPAR